MDWGLQDSLQCNPCLAHFLPYKISAFFGELADPLAAEALPDFFSHGQALRRAEIVNITLSEPVAQYLAGFEHLAWLSVFLDHRWSPSQISGFQALVDLNIHQKNMKLLSGCLSCLYPLLAEDVLRTILSDIFIAYSVDLSS